MEPGRIPTAVVASAKVRWGKEDLIGTKQGFGIIYQNKSDHDFVQYNITNSS